MWVTVMGALGDGLEFFQLIKIVMFNNEANIKPGVGVGFGEMVHFGFCFPNFIFQVVVRDDGGMQGFYFAALGGDKLGQAGEDAGRVILPGGCVMTFVIFYDNHFGTSFHRSLEVVGGKRLADFAVGGEDGGVVTDKIMQAGTQGTEDCVFVVMGGSFVIIALPGDKVGPDCFGFPIILEEGRKLAGIILLPGFGKTDTAIDAGGHVIGDFLLCGADGLIHATDFVVLQFHCGTPFNQRIIWVPSSRALRRVSASALRSVKFSLGKGELTA